MLQPDFKLAMVIFCQGLVFPVQLKGSNIASVIQRYGKDKLFGCIYTSNRILHGLGNRQTFCLCICEACRRVWCFLPNLPGCSACPRLDIAIGHFLRYAILCPIRDSTDYFLRTILHAVYGQFSIISCHFFPGSRVGYCYTGQLCLFAIQQYLTCIAFKDYRIREFPVSPHYCFLQFQASEHSCVADASKRNRPGHFLKGVLADRKWMLCRIPCRCLIVLRCCRLGQYIAAPSKAADCCCPVCRYTQLHLSGQYRFFHRGCDYKCFPDRCQFARLIRLAQCKGCPIKLRSGLVYLLKGYRSGLPYIHHDDRTGFCDCIALPGYRSVFINGKQDVRCLLIAIRHCCLHQLITAVCKHSHLMARCGCRPGGYFAPAFRCRLIRPGQAVQRQRCTRHRCILCPHQFCLIDRYLRIFLLPILRNNCNI